MPELADADDVTGLARGLIVAERAQRGHTLDPARRLQAPPLERQGGTRMLRLAAALPRTPDGPTRIALLADKPDAADSGEAVGERAPLARAVVALAAMMRSSPPHLGQRCRSMSNTRFNSRAQPVRCARARTGSTSHPAPAAAPPAACA